MDADARPRGTAFAWVLALAVVVIVYSTMFPFDFLVVAERGPLEVLGEFDLGATETYVLRDGVLNFVLFLPFGFGLAGVLGQSGRRTGRLSIVGGAGVALSVLLEFVQSWALVRVPSLLDVVTNSVGVVAGVGAFRLFANRAPGWTGSRRTRSRRSSALRAFAVAHGVWFVVLLVLLRSAAAQTQLEDWDTDMVLSLGNETTGDRPWRGSIQRIYVIDRSVSDDDVRELATRDGLDPASGSFVVRHDFTDGMAGFPALRGVSGGVSPTSPAGVAVDETSWLESETGVAEVSRALERTSEFTIGLELRTGDLDQSGPARILSISDGLFRRNLTIGQDGSMLVLRIRTPLTGPDGTDPELTVPEFFSDREVHHVLVRYDGSVLRVGTDAQPSRHVLDLGPETSLALRAFPAAIERLRVDSAISHWVLMTTSRALVLVPGAMLLSVWRRSVPDGRRASIRVAVGFAGLPLLFEVMLLGLTGISRFGPGVAVVDSMLVGMGYVASRVGAPGEPRCRNPGM